MPDGPQYFLYTQKLSKVLSKSEKIDISLRLSGGL